MASEHKLIFRTAAGVKVAEVNDYLSLAYTREVNGPGLVKFTLNGSHAAIGLLEDKGQIDVYRRNTAMGMPWTIEMTALFREQKRSFTDRPVFEATCPGVMSMLGWRVVAWPAETANRSQFTSVAAETIMKMIVDRNAGPNATAASGRVRDGTLAAIAIEMDGANGNVVSWSCAWDVVLKSLQDLALIAGGDFDLVRTESGFEFRWYTGQRGTDRHTTVKFAPELGNMEKPVYEEDRTAEATVAIVGGQGNGSDRAVVVRTGEDYAAGNDIELFSNGSQYGTTGGLNAAGDSTLKGSRAKRSFTFAPLQTPATFYGKHYFLGDLVSARYEDVSGTFKVMNATVEAKPGADESVKVGLVQWPM